MRARHEHDAELELFYLLKGQQLARAHNLLVERIMPELILSGELVRCKRYLQHFQPPAAADEAQKARFEAALRKIDGSDFGLRLYLDYFEFLDFMQDIRRKVCTSRSILLNFLILTPSNY